MSPPARPRSMPCASVPPSPVARAIVGHRQSADIPSRASRHFAGNLHILDGITHATTESLPLWD
eukprot:8323211-Alexandrium_andersonii.AAC.1